MSLAEWLRAFRALHERARPLLAAQRLTLKPGEKPREALRVAVALQVDLDFATTAFRAVTADLATGGFACLLGKAPPPGEEARCSIRIPGGEPLAGRVRVADVKPLQGNVRVAFQLLSPSAADRERLALLVFDTVLGQLTAWRRPALGR